MSNTLRKLKLRKKIILKRMELKELQASYKQLKSSTEAKIAIKGLGMELHSDTDFYPTESEISDDSKTNEERQNGMVDYLRAQPEERVKCCLPDLWRELSDCDMPKKLSAYTINWDKTPFAIPHLNLVWRAKSSM